MKTDIILSGVGGQGILSIAAVIGEAALKEGLYMKQAEVHGMSQRGGDVQSNLRLSDEPIASDLIPKGHADLIISLEPMESLRYLPYLKKEGACPTRRSLSRSPDSSGCSRTDGSSSPANPLSSGKADNASSPSVPTSRSPRT